MNRLLLVAALLASMTIARAQMIMVGVENQTAAAAGYTGPGDVVSGAFVWWGLRAYNAAYAAGLGKIANVCQPGGVTCADVNSDASGNFNLAGSGLTCNNGGSICTVKTLYDQSGAASCSGACDVTQTTTANQPTLVTPGGCPVISASRFCISVAFGTNVALESAGSNAVSKPQPYTFSMAYQNPVRQGDETLYAQTFTFPLIVSGFGGGDSIGVFNLTTNANLAVTTAYHAVQIVANTTSSDINVDGTANATTVGANVNFPTGQHILLNAASLNNSFGGTFQELGIWNSAFSGTNSSNMSSNQHTYWGF